MAKRILITGGAGFIGSELSRQWTAQDAEVTIVDNLVNGKRDNVSDILSPHCRLEECDIRDTTAMEALLKGVDIVYHLACLGVRHSIHSPYENHEVNAEATLKLLLAAQKSRVGRFVYVSTSEVYGTASFVPMPEEHSTLPHTVYGASKLAGECYTRAFHDTYSLDTVIVRPFNAYGPRCHHEGDSGEVIPKFLLRALAGKPLIIFGDGTQTRDFTFVSDTARGILTAGLHPSAIGRTFNLGSGFEMTIKDLAETIARSVGLDKATVQHDAPRPGDVLRLYSDSRRSAEVLGFKPEISLEQGIQHLKDWYSSQPTSPDALLEQEVVHNWKGTLDQKP